MGIRFYCPNGHKLHVKAFQAGQRGVCPHCGAKFLIPHESTRPSSREEKAAESQASEETELQIEPTTHPSDLIGGEEPPQVGAIPTVQPQADLAQPASVAPSSCPPTVVPVASDPLDEAPEAVWYVRPPGGEQFGPATAEIMRAWLAEERIGPDYHVWREGWRDWAEAAEVFARWQEAPAGPEIHPIGTVPTTTMTTEAALRRLRARRRSRAWGMFVVFLLLLIVIVLGVVFFHILQEEPKPPGASLFPTISDMSRLAREATTAVLD